MYLKLKSNIHSCYNLFFLTEQFFSHGTCVSVSSANYVLLHSYLHREITAQKTAQKGNLCKNIRSEGKHHNEKYMHSILPEKYIKLSTYMPMKILILFKTTVSITP